MAARKVRAPKAKSRAAGDDAALDDIRECVGETNVLLRRIVRRLVEIKGVLEKGGSE